MILQMRFVQPLQQAQLVPPRFFRDVRRRLEIEDRRPGRTELSALVDRGQPPGGPVPHSINGQASRVRKNDISGQVLALGSQAINHPGSPSGPASLEFARMNDAQRRLVIDRIGDHRAD